MYRGWAGGLGAGIALALLLLFAAVIAVAYSGAYNVAATDGHWPFTRWSFETTMHNSVAARAAEVPAAPRFTEDTIAAGAGEFKAMCEHCHGGPGIERAEWAEGMLPNPPQLSEAAAEWSAEEIYWIVRHGVKMSGMPAFGPTHDEETLWNIVAFVDRLAAVTPAEYARYAAEHGHGEDGHGVEADELQLDADTPGSEAEIPEGIETDGSGSAETGGPDDGAETGELGADDVGPPPVAPETQPVTEPVTGSAADPGAVPDAEPAPALP